MPSFSNSSGNCTWQVVVKIVESHNFGGSAIKFVYNLLVMSNTDVLSHFLLLLHMMLLSSPERLALEVIIDCLVEIYKLITILQDLLTPSITNIGKMDLSITNLEYFCLAHVVFKEES